ncbi:MAG: lipopolysaccharide biosynthesis protein [Nevskiales bacterium]
MLRSFLRDSAVYVLPTILSRGIGLILLPLYTHFLSPAEYGLLELLLAITALTNLVLPLEINQAVMRFLPETDPGGARVRLVSTAFWFVVGVYTALVLICWALPELARLTLFAGNGDSAWVRLAVVSMMSGTLLYTLQIQLRACQQARAYALVSAMAVTLTAAAVSGVLLFTSWRVHGVVAAQILGALGAVGLALLLVRRTTPVRTQFDPMLLRRMLGFSAPLVLSSIAVYVTLYLDRWLIQALLGMDELGLYGIAMRLASVVGLMIYPFQMALTPLVYAHHAEPDTPVHLARLFEAFWAVCLCIVAAVGLFAPEIFRLLASREFAAAAPLAGWMCLTTLMVNTYIFFPGLWLSKRTGVITAVNVAAAASNIALNLLLIPLLGLKGVAVATAASGLVMLVLFAWLGARHYPIPIVPPRAGAALGVVLVLQTFIYLDAVPPLLVRLLLAVAIMPLILFALWSPLQLRAYYAQAKTLLSKAPS